MNNKRILLTVFVIAMVCCVAAVTIACQPTDFTINFVVDGSNYTTLSTSGQEVIPLTAGIGTKALGSARLPKTHIPKLKTTLMFLLNSAL